MAAYPPSSMRDPLHGTEYGIAPGNVWRNEMNSATMVSLPVTAHLSLVVCKTESGFIVSVSQQAMQRDPKVYAGNSLEDLVKTVLGEIVAGKLEA